MNVMAKLNRRFIIHFFGYIFATLLIFIGGYYILWALQGASFSVAAGSAAQEIYKARAEIMFPIGLLFIAVGILYFCIVFSSRSSERK